MLEKANTIRTASATDEDETWTAGAAAVAAHNEIDNELQAAIEYKIALSGLLGADKVIELLNIALSRRGR